MSSSDASPTSGALRPNVLMAFACENVTSDPGAPVSFQHIMDGIGVVDFPAVTGRWLAIFCFWSLVELRLPNCRVVVAAEDGEIIAQTQLKDLTFSANSQISRSVVAFQGLAWPHPGRYIIMFIANKDDLLASFPMLVQQAPPSAGESAQAPPR
ncbi:MAG: hypothetical protein ABI186_01215 [Candidatus Elarobacter sp.]